MRFKSSAGMLQHPASSQHQEEISVSTVHAELEQRIAAWARAQDDIHAAAWIVALHGGR
ncbi:MAG: hypothetical protein IH587_00685 [Anaerolineae bacterium]|nr:hypothetical protein [Anaerolineae bacterium]